jgi:hypothetical protein
MASICSEHMLGKEDPNCPRCKCDIDFGLPEGAIVTCPTCNFVFYNVNVCPKCQTVNI